VPDFDWVTDPDILGVTRSLEPPGALPHLATRLDAESDPNEFEVGLDVELLNIDATSFRELSARGGGEATQIAQLIRDIVMSRGKLHNPWTSSGGVLVGRVATRGAQSAGTKVAVGERIVPLVSLIALPLRLDAVGPVDPTRPQVPAVGRAIVTGRMPFAIVPPDLPLQVALTAFDVYPAASHVRVHARSGDHVLILGAGHAGLLAAAAARECVGEAGHVSVVDVSNEALERLMEVVPDSVPIRADATSPLAVARLLQSAGLPRADVTLVCATVPGCEGSAILATADSGVVLFFSTATSFSAAALGTDAVGSRARLVIPNGCTEDEGRYTIELLRRIPALQASFQV
jgi:L-erythro-3,5-diaminohexanoate dehydrogenase